MADIRIQMKSKNGDSVDNLYPKTKTDMVEGLPERLAEKATKEELNALGELKISGVYATLSALQSALPDGASGLYLVTADGYTYRWSSSDWVRVAQFQSTGIADKTITMRKLGAFLQDDIIDSVSYTPFEKELNTYPTALSATADSLYIERTALSAQGRVILHVYARTAHSCFVVLLKKELSSNVTYTLQEHIAVSLTQGINEVDTGFSVNGDLTEFIGLVGDSFGPVSLNYKTVATNRNYTGMTGFSFDVPTFRADPSTSTRELSFFAEIVKTKNEKITENIAVLDERVSALEGVDNAVDLVMFVGQSNMAGRGTAEQAPSVPSGHGYEFRAITDPTQLYDVVEPFGVGENVAGAITETTKTGSMVSSFINAYYGLTKRPIVGVSASRGGTRIIAWAPGGALLNDAINRFNIAQNWLNDNGYTIRSKSMVWCQGESDGDNAMSGADYKTRLSNIVNTMLAEGIEKCYLVRIGNHRDQPALYDEIIQAQTEICKTNPNIVLISTKFAGMAAAGLMKDQYHYTQEGYNIVGKDAGLNMAFYTNNHKEPYMYDTETAGMYFSEKS